MQFNQTQIFNARQSDLSRDKSPTEMNQANDHKGMEKQWPENMNMYWTESKQAPKKVVVMSEE